MTIKGQLASQLQSVLHDLGFEAVAPAIDYPVDKKHGDYATNIALVAAKKLQMNPMELAQEIAEKFKNQSIIKIIEKIEVVKPGFINFFITPDYFVSELEKQAFEGAPSLQGTKIIIEFTDPNPFKEFHIGHLYSNIVGESLARLLQANGADVYRVDYFGDVGMHVARSLWGLKEKFKEQKSNFKNMEALERRPLQERMKFLGEAYAKGAAAFEESKEAAEEMKKLNRLVYIAAQKMWQEEEKIIPQVDYSQGQTVDQKELAEVYALYTKGRKWSLAYFETIYSRLGTAFDDYFPESIAAERGYKLVKDNIAKGVFVESEGAVVFPGEKYGLHTRVFINSLGLPTYEAKELGLAPWKFERFAYEKSLIVTGNEINAYFNVLVCAMSQINRELGERTIHIGHGMVRLPEGKMSSRTGNIKTGESLLDEAANQATKLAEGGDKVLAEKIGQAAIKYAFLKQSLGKDVIFNFEESINFEGNSGPYLQYTFARTQSVLEKDQKTQLKDQKEKDFEIGKIVLENEERELLKFLARYPEIIEEAGVRLSPTIVCQYLFELAQVFNLCYQKYPILKAEENVKAFRLFLTRATGEALKQGLQLLGIQAPEKM